ncbi:Heat shock protein 105 kDa [Anas platyrhynchos]|uniref:Heat shock protein 105 kDa n=1 Tax=Anas platyrhynchos TaxID=8839 RepID=R0J629_ANAPL|nr:Heat shock protein 105 kDa [Anas platyrhynchos]
MVEPVKSEDSEDVGVETEVETQDQRPAENSNDTNEKKGDQPPEAKKPKIKVKNVELPIEANLVWQLGKDLLNMYIETEVS